MPDHAHLLLEGLTAESDVLRLLTRWKQRTACRAWRMGYQRLWQSSFYDRVLRSDEDSLKVTRYIVANPVRAGLVRAIEDYPLSGSGCYSMQAIAEALLGSG